MQTMVVTSSNKESMLEAHANTFQMRRQFVLEAKPLIETVLSRYPRFRDLTETVNTIPLLANVY